MALPEKVTCRKIYESDMFYLDQDETFIFLIQCIEIKNNLNYFAIRSTSAQFFVVFFLAWELFFVCKIFVFMFEEFKHYVGVFGKQDEIHLDR